MLRQPYRCAQKSAERLEHVQLRAYMTACVSRFVIRPCALQMLLNIVAIFLPLLTKESFTAAGIDVQLWQIGHPFRSMPRSYRSPSRLCLHPAVPPSCCRCACLPAPSSTYHSACLLPPHLSVTPLPLVLAVRCLSLGALRRRHGDRADCCKYVFRPRHCRLG